MDADTRPTALSPSVLIAAFTCAAMSFGRAFRPTTPLSSSARSPSPHEAALSAHHAEQSSRRDQASEARQEKMRAERGMFGYHPEKSKWTPRTDSHAQAVLLHRRLNATSTPTSVLTVDPTYSKRHNIPFHSVKQVRQASWEHPVTNLDIPLKRLALVERPDLEEENRRHVEEVTRREEQRAQQQQTDAFLFREQQLAHLHKRKRERIALETRAALRPSSSGKPRRFPDTGVAPSTFTVDAPQYSVTSVPSPSRSGWNSAHQLARSLVTHPYIPSPELSQLAGQRIEKRMEREWEARVKKREEGRRKREEIHAREQFLRYENQLREELLNERFGAREFGPQNIDVHLSYLTSSRCAPRPPSVRPTTAEPHRVMAPLKTTSLSHVSVTGPNSVRSQSRHGGATWSGYSSRAPSSARGASAYPAHGAISGDQQEDAEYEEQAAPYIRDASPTDCDSALASPALSPRASPVPRLNVHSAARTKSAASGSDIPVVLSPRSSSRLGTLTTPIHAPLSPRLEHLSAPLARLMRDSKVGREHRDYRGLRVPTPPRAQPTPPEIPSSTSDLARSTLSSRPSTARSRFDRESRAARSPSRGERRVERQATKEGTGTAEETTWNGDSQQEDEKEQFYEGSIDSTPLASTSRSGSSSTARPPSSSRSYPVTGSGVRLHGNTERLPMWNRTNRLLKYVGQTPR
jgi:hypothetical protein